ncbi:MAG: polyhydroxyalkanoate depolymerase [Alphaproteobacteria bacterium]|nr:polyhydroxyalkanoate depolymerase [Alphaproteobacteria bacterium]
MKYHAYELAHAIVSPWRLASQGLRYQLDFPLNPFSALPFVRGVSAACNVFERLTDRYGKPEWEIDATEIDGKAVPVTIETYKHKPFCNLIHFKRDLAATADRNDPKVLIVAPMSGHYATLLRGTVKAMIREHDVYVTDWIDARQVPTYEGRFDLDDFIDYIIEFTQELGPDMHVMAVCQPAVPCLAATAIMAARDMPVQPLSLTMMGGPIDTRRNPTVVNELAEQKPLSWFEQNVISHVPFPNPGFMRRVYPGFIQLTGFMTMNLERHREAHWKLFDHLVEGDEDSIAAHEKFYDEYLAVMDLPAEFYLQTVHTAFQSHALPMGRMMHRDEPVDCSMIRHTAIITIEGENDDICGIGQTEAAHRLCTNVPPEAHFHYVQPGVGHYGVFNGRRWRNEIQPRIAEQIRRAEKRAAQPAEAPVADAVATLAQSTVS